MTTIVFDTEDDSAELLAANKSGFGKRVTQIAAVNSRAERYYSRGNVTEFLSWIAKQAPCEVWAHNLAYDLGNIFGRSLDAIDVTLVGSRMIRAQWGSVTFRDTFNLWPMSLASIGEAFKIRKRAFNATSKAYVFRDVEIALRALTFTRQKLLEFDITKVPSTLGGLAVGVWRALGGDSWFDDSAMSRNALYGGRVELFASGGNDVFLYDINSLYPYCMTKDFPQLAQPMGDFETGFGCADVTITVPEQFLCPLPFRRQDHRVCFPYGTFRGVWTFHEIRNAITHHSARVIKCHSAYGSNVGSPFYRDFVHRLFAFRQSSKSEAERLFWKLALNNLYGQLAVSGEITRTLSISQLPFKPEAVVFGQKILAPFHHPLPAHTNYLHAAYVTSYGRLRLLEFLRQIPEERLIYCDTDSVLCVGAAPWQVASELGGMKLELHEQSCSVEAPKMYRIGNRVKAKGVPRRFAHEFFEHGQVEYSQPFRYREAVTFYDRKNSRQLSVWRKVTKVKLSKYDQKRKVGKTFRPKKACAL